MRPRVLPRDHCISACTRHIRRIQRDAQTRARRRRPGIKTAIAQSVWKAISAGVGEHVRREDELDMPVVVGTAEEVDFETAMLGYVLVLDEDGAVALHIAG